MEETYLREKLGPPLIAAISDVVQRRPSDPIEYMGNFLRDYCEKNIKLPQSAAVDNIMRDMLAQSRNTQRHVVIKNEFKAGLVVPERRAVASAPCPRAYANSKWPIHCYAPLDFWVNPAHGGCALLVQCSCSYGGKGEETSAELLLGRCGFDSNFYNVHSIKKSNSGHFGCENTHIVTEDGRLLPDLMFGHNYVAYLSNNPEYGDLSHGVYMEGEQEGHQTEGLVPVNENGSGNTVVLCSAGDSGAQNAVYMIRAGFKDDFIQKNLLVGEDLWEFSVDGHGLLIISGPAQSQYGVYHNRDNLAQSGENTGAPDKCFAHLSQALDGSSAVDLVAKVPAKATALVLCSHSSGVEDRTSAAIYKLLVTPDNVDASLLAGQTGTNYAHDNADLWQFRIDNGRLTVAGPTGPCRYAILTNVRDEAGMRPPAQRFCLACGEENPVKGVVVIDDAGVTGWVNKSCGIVVKTDEEPKYEIAASDLVKTEGDRYAFFFAWRKDDLPIGLHMVRVFAQRTHVVDGSEVEVELSGSPKDLSTQPKGVVYALNCGGPAYQALNDIVYSSEHRQFHSIGKDHCFGSRSKALGGAHSLVKRPQLLNHTEDGDLYATTRSPGVEPVDEQKVNYVVENLPKGKYTFRLHITSGVCNHFQLNGKDVSSKVREALLKLKHRDKPYTALQVEVPVEVQGTLTVFTTAQLISGFALLAKDYKEKELSEAEKRLDAEIKQKLADHSEPLPRSMTRKERKIVGWSPNLLQNGSGEANSMAYWSTGGDWKIHEGGHGTEKAFVTSHMWCKKYQEVDLTEFFSEEYLDTAPEIQVSEWYREGVCGGGHYQFKAGLLDDSGQSKDYYEIPETGRLYKNNAWMQESKSFTNYGPGVRRVFLESLGKDDKFWGGHFGVITSDAMVRVKRESQKADNDVFEDVITPGEAAMAERSAKREKLVADVLSSNQDLLEELIEEDVVAAVDPVFEKMTAPETDRKAKKKRRRREIRVFVSSTFRDFKNERENLIKKTFREINAICAGRGVFFTYVDLRWGITEDQTNHGKTIAICLNEIDRCRPYFICMLGERFGWSQTEDKPDELLDGSFKYAIKTYPKALGWIEQHRFDTSVTQLEVMHGVLNDVGAWRDRSFFYLRAPVRRDSCQDDKEFAVMNSESDWHHEKVHSLRKKVETTEGLNIRNYSVAPEVCDLIKTDLEWCVDQDFPEGTQLTPLEREKEAHTAFAEARRRVYIGGTQYFKAIDEHMSEHRSKPLCIMGNSGGGKSALVANWAGRTEEEQPDTFMFVHFIGSSAESSSYLKLIRRMCTEIKTHFNLDTPIASSDSNLVRDLSLWIKMAASRSKCIFVLDALNQLDDGTGDEGNEHDLSWIPRELPEGAFMLLSTLPGRAKEAVLAAGWPTLEVHPLQEDQKLEIVTGYMEGIYGKTLAAGLKDMIVQAPQTNNPLYLKALLDEVRMFGSFRLLEGKIKEYLSAGTPGDLFAKILERLEQDFETGQHDAPNLVRDTTRAIWCSNRGMSESELLEILEIPSAVWSPFYLSLVENLVNRNGILNFFHDHLRQAVESKYLATAQDKKKAYLWLADFFSSREVDDRVAEELPSLLAKAGELDRLKSIVSNLDIFERLAKTEDGKFDLIKSWKLLGDFTQVDEAYMGELAKLSEADMSLDRNVKLQQMLADFMVELGLYTPARTIFQDLLKQLESRYADGHSAIIYNPFNHTRTYKCKHPDVIDLLHNIGRVCEKQQDFDSGIGFYAEAIARQNKMETPQQKLQLCEGLLGEATIRYLMQDMAEAMKYLVRARQLATDVLGPRHHYVAAIINKLGQLSYKQGRIDDALGYFLQDLKLTRGEVGSTHPRTAGILNDIALVYDDKTLPLAGQLYEVALATLLDTYGDSHIDVAVTRYNLGAFYLATNHFDRAKYQFTQAVKIYENFLGSDHPETQEAATALSDCD